MSHYYLTTPIYYVNDRPHIGHAYTSVACDVLARFKRLSGESVKFLTGTDEHGQKVEKSAAAAGVAPKDFVDGVSVHFREMAKLMNISHDDFIRTTEPRHIRSAQALWKKMADAKAPDGSPNIYKGNYGGWYSVRDEAYYQESELVNGKAPTGADVEWVEEESYFFALSKWQDKLLAFYEANPGFIQPESRKNEIISFVKGGLRDLSISRTTFSWGIPVPGDEKHIMYVWLDALANYLSALGYPEMAGDFWPADLHMVGKDIIRFHAVYWPAFLMAADLPCPKQVFAHGWWTIEGEKMSKSLGNVIAPADLVAEFGLDQTRWFLMREVPFGNDGNFSRERMITVINSELANNIGNLCQRTLSMINKNCGGVVPAKGALTDEDQFLITHYKRLFCGDEKEYPTKQNTDPTGAIHVPALHFQGVSLYNMMWDNPKILFDNLTAQIIEIANRANVYIDAHAPWKLKKDNNQARMETVLYVSASLIRIIGILLQPVVPDAATKILDLLAIPEGERTLAHIAKKDLEPGTPLPPPSGVFPRVGGAA